MDTNDLQSIIAGAPGVSDDWGDPEPFDGVEACEPYPLDGLPATMRDAVVEVQRFTQAPAALVASCAVGVVSLATQGLIDVERARGLSGPTSLFMLIVAESGERKTTVDRYFTQAIEAYTRDAIEEAQPDLRRFKADWDAWDSKRKGILMAIRDKAKKRPDADDLDDRLRMLQTQEPERPKVPDLILQDATPEALAYNLAMCWPSSAVISSEAAVVFGGHGMGRDSVMRNLGMLNTLWDGRSLDVKRRTVESYRVDGARLSLSLQVQPDTLNEFLDSKGRLARGSGFLARFLVASPESTIGARPFREAPEHWPALASFDERASDLLRTALPYDEKGRLRPERLPLSRNAFDAWRMFHDGVECELRDGGEFGTIKDAGAKAADNAARLGALFHYFQHGKTSVCTDCFEGAGRIVAWHLGESRRLLGARQSPAFDRNARILDGWLLRRCIENGVTAIPITEIHRCGPARVREKADLEPARAVLESMNRARLTTSGRKQAIAVNPRLLPAAAAVSAVSAVPGEAA